MDTPGFWLAAVGLVLTGLGLGITWWQWSERRKKFASSLAQLLQRKPTTQVVNLEAALLIEVALSATGYVTRPGQATEERLLAIETDVGGLEARRAEAERLLLRQIDELRAAQVAERDETDRRIASALDAAKYEVSKATLSGIWVAIAGVVLSLAGLLVDNLWPDWHF